MSSVGDLLGTVVLANGKMLGSVGTAVEKKVLTQAKVVARFDSDMDHIAMDAKHKAAKAAIRAGGKMIKAEEKAKKQVGRAIGHKVKVEGKALKKTGKAVGNLLGDKPVLPLAGALAAGAGGLAGAAQNIAPLFNVGRGVDGLQGLPGNMIRDGLQNLGRNNPFSDDNDSAGNNPITNTIATVAGQAVTGIVNDALSGNSNAGGNPISNLMSGFANALPGFPGLGN